MPYYAKNGAEGAAAHGRYLYFSSAEEAKIACALLNSNIFYVFFIAFSDCFHLSDGIAAAFPVAPSVWADKDIISLNDRLMNALQGSAVRKIINSRNRTGIDAVEYDEYSGQSAKGYIDEIDRRLATHFALPPSVVDAVINYDIKYRMGQGTEVDD